MDTSAMIHAMKDSISEVLEQMFFLPIDFMDPEHPPGNDGAKDGDMLSTRVGFNGKPSGLFLLTMPEGLASAVTADFMGVLPETLSNEQITGTIMEMINMLAGNTLSAYAPESVFDLQIPEMLPPAGAASSGTDRGQIINIGIQTLESQMTLQLIVADV